MGKQHILSAAQFDNAFVESLCEWTEDVRKHPQRIKRLDRVRLVGLFDQPSLRTRTTFQWGAELLGAHVTWFDRANDSLALKKQESLEHTIRSFAHWGTDVVVLRYPEAGVPAKMAALEECSIINAGDGGRGGEHPTQALIDAVTLVEECGYLQSLHIAFSGDMTARTARSLVTLLSQTGVSKLYFAAPKKLSLETEIRERLDAAHIHYEEFSTLKALLTSRHIDVLYMTRIQRENFVAEPSLDLIMGAEKTRLTQDLIKLLPEHTKVMHPMPIDKTAREIDPAFDDDPRALYWRQSENGLAVRMALLEMLFFSDPPLFR